MSVCSPELRSCIAAGPVRSASAGAHLPVWVALLIAAAVQVWLVSAGYWTFLPTYSDRYDRLAAAFAAGQTSLTIPADPALLSLPDPYDPVANKPYRDAPGVHDACLYNGRLYYYWGPAPALLLTPAKWIAGARFVVGDEYLCLFFSLGLTAVTAAFLLQVRNRYFPDTRTDLVAAGVLLAGLGTPITCILTRAAVYEAAILGGQFFLLLGVLLTWRGLSRDARPVSLQRPGFDEDRSILVADATQAAHSIPSSGTLFFAGACLTLAVGSRVSLAVAVTAIAGIATAMLAWRFRATPRTVVRPWLAFATPLVAGAALLCLYNYVRFDHPLQFGQKYQLAGANLLALPGLFGVDNLWPNLWSYFVRPIAGVARFPFVVAVPGYEQFPSFIRIPHGYEIYEPISGLPWVMPVLLLIPMALLLSMKRRASNDAPTATPADCGPWGSRHGFRTLVVLLLTAAVLGFAPVLLMIGSSQRYLADFTPPLVVLVIIAVWTMTVRANPRQARRRLAIFSAFAALTIVIGVLISIEGYGMHFRFKNPALFRTLTGQGPELPPDPADNASPESTHAG